LVGAGVSVFVAVGGGGVFVGVFVAVGGTGVAVGVFVAVGGSGVFVGVFVGVGPATTAPPPKLSSTALPALMNHSPIYPPPLE
jgi:hypothetical protein